MKQIKKKSSDNRKKVSSILETLLRDKLGGTNYKKYLPLDNLKKSIIEYITAECEKQGVQPGLDYTIILNSIRKIKSASSPEEVLLILSDTLFNISGLSV